MCVELQGASFFPPPRILYSSWKQVYPLTLALPSLAACGEIKRLALGIALPFCLAVKILPEYLSVDFLS